jgi:CRP-like cAMP-binding protein/rhodanese-related sulfurtransferase
MISNMDVARLSDFSPFGSLKTDNLESLLANVEILQASKGQTLFQKGDPDKYSVYLLHGTLELSGDDSTGRQITGGTDEARHPVSPMCPRQETAVAVDDVQYFTIDSELLDMTLMLNQTGVYEVADFGSAPDAGEGDWMTSFLQTELFQQIPPHCIQKIFMRLQRQDFNAGDVVIEQGKPGEHFYIVRSGRCIVTRETPAGKDDIDLAVLRSGGSFGEEALINETERNATVRMQTDGILMKLGRADFQELLNEPLVVPLDPEGAEEAAAHGAKWLDVRVPSEFAANGKSGAINIPLYLLRHKLDMLDPATPYIVYCDTGRRSAAAAFILNKKGFQSAVLSGGLNSSI